MFRVAFLGRGSLGLRVLKGLLANPNVEVPVIIACRATPEVSNAEADFARVAEAHQIDFYQTNYINKPEWVRLLRSYEADVAVALLWLHTIGREVIETTRHGFINFHGGLLPAYRGNACANWAILNGEEKLGATVHFMTPGDLDSGPIIRQETIPIGTDTYVGDLTRACEEVGVRLVLDAVESLRVGNIKTIRQSQEAASYCYPRLPRDGEIDWRRPGREVEKLVRASGAPYPGAYSYFSDVRGGNRIRKMTVWAAHLEAHPLPEFYAVPGHLLRFNGGDKWGVVCGDRAILVLDEIEVDGTPGEPREFFKTVRQRFGLDVATHLEGIERRLAECETALRQPGLPALSEQFLKAGAAQVEKLLATVDEAIESVVGVLAENGIRAEANPLRNYSFQKRFYDWEQRERWFGVQIYRSFRLLEMEGEPVAVGLWYFSDCGTGVEQRVYLSIKPGYAAAYSRRCRDAAERVFPGYRRFDYPGNASAASGWYVDVSALAVGDVLALMADFARLLSVSS
jgi:methionyl-tRNA formyltransferase